MAPTGSARPEILSYGADGKPGGEHLDADISSIGGYQIVEPSTKAKGVLIALWICCWIWLIISVLLLKNRSLRRRRSK